MRGAGKALALCALLLALLALFWVSVAARQDRFGNLEGRGHEWLTGSAVKFTRNWYREGAWKLRFAMLENPRSIEFADLRSREPYVSYPVGCLLPVYVVSRLVHREPSPVLVMSVDLANQLLGALAAFAILFLALEGLGLGAGWRAAFGGLGFLFVVFLPGPFYWLQNVYFSDQAIVPIFLAVVLLEVLHDRRPRRSLEVAQALVVGWGVFTDWFMVPIAAALLVKRWLFTWRGETIAARLRRSIFLLLPAALALVLFALQVASLDGLASLRHKLLNRTGLTPGMPYHFSQLYERFWLTYVPRNFGNDLAPWSIALSMVALVALALFRRGARHGDAEEDRTLWLGVLLLAPPIVHCLVFWQHSVDHSFTPLRFLPAFACLPFAIVPALIARRAHMTGWARTSWLMLVLVGGMLFGNQKSLGSLEQARRPETPAIGRSLSRLMSYEDVVFSPDFEVPANPPELLAYSMKRVYRVGSPDSLATRLESLPTGARVRLVFLQDPDSTWDRLLSGAVPRDDGMLRAYDLGLARDVRKPSTVRSP